MKRFIYCFAALSSFNISVATDLKMEFKNWSMTLENYGHELQATSFEYFAKFDAVKQLYSYSSQSEPEVDDCRVC